MEFRCIFNDNNRVKELLGGINALKTFTSVTNAVKNFTSESTYNKTTCFIKLSLVLKSYLQRTQAFQLN